MQSAPNVQPSAANSKLARQRPTKPPILAKKKLFFSKDKKIVFYFTIKIL